MKVLYVSKALTVAAYRDKLRALGRYAEVRAVAPARWGGRDAEPGDPGGPEVEAWPAALDGHNHLHLYRRAGRMVARDPPDLVHIDEEPYSAVTFQLVRVCRRRGIPALFFAWQNLPKRLPPPFGALRAYVFRRAAGAIAGTDAALDVLRLAGYDGPAAVIPQFGVDPDRFAPDPARRREVRERLDIAGDAFVVGFAGRLVPEKGAHLLLEAVARAATMRAEDASPAGAGRADHAPGSARRWHLVLLGDGPERERLARAASQAGMADRVHLVGRVRSLEMPRWLVALDALALPSLARPGWVEQFGRVLVEAMACGVPVIGSDAGEIPAVIGDAGAVVPQGDAEALAGELAELAGNPERRHERGRRGRERVLERFTHDRIARATAAFYGEVSPTARCGAPGPAGVREAGGPGGRAAAAEEARS